MPNNPIHDEQLAYLDRLHETAIPLTFANAAGHIFNAYPALRQRLLDAESRLAEAERERDAYKAQCSALLDAINIQEQDQMARDAQQRCEGAAEAYERAADMLSVFPGGADAEEMMRDAAKRLREGKDV